MSRPLSPARRALAGAISALNEKRQALVSAEQALSTGEALDLEAEQGVDALSARSVAAGIDLAAMIRAGGSGAVPGLETGAAERAAATIRKETTAAAVVELKRTVAQAEKDLAEAVQQRAEARQGVIAELVADATKVGSEAIEALIGAQQAIVSLARIGYVQQPWGGGMAPLNLTALTKRVLALDLQVMEAPPTRTARQEAWQAFLEALGNDPCAEAPSTASGMTMAADPDCLAADEAA